MDLSFDFKHLDIDQQTARMDLPWVAPGAFLILRPANDSNKPFHNAVLRTSGRRQITSAKITHESLEQDRAEDLKLYPEFVAVGWGGITTKGGVAVEFSRESATAFFKALPNWIFDRIRIFAMRPENFLRDADPDPVTLAGNS